MTFMHSKQNRIKKECFCDDIKHYNRPLKALSPEFQSLSNNQTIVGSIVDNCQTGK